MLLCAPLLALIPERVMALQFHVGPGKTVEQMFTSAATTLLWSGRTIVIAVFVIGAIIYATSMGAEDRKSAGKKTMISAVIATIVIAGADKIMQTVLYFLYG